MVDIAGLRRKKGWMNLRVVKTRDDTHDTRTFYMIDDDEGNIPFDYIAGQYLTFRFDGVQDKPLVRSYTMSSSPVETDACAFTVKRVEKGVISNWLCDHVEVGSILKARGPIGRFCWGIDSSQPHLYMVAAGSGVTPFISILREYQGRLGQEGAPASMNLLVSYRTTDDLICMPEIEEARRHPGVRVAISLTRQETEGDDYLHGRPDQAMVQDFLTHDSGQCTFMTCGPEGLMDMTTAFAKGLGVDDKHILTEAF